MTLNLSPPVVLDTEVPRMKGNRWGCPYYPWFGSLWIHLGLLSIVLKTV